MAHTISSNRGALSLGPGNPSYNPLTILAGVTVAGAGNAISASSGWTILNLGTVSASSGDGVYLDAGGTLTNSGANAHITAGGNYGVRVNNAAGFVTNNGTITSGVAGVDFLRGGTLTNSGTQALISAADWGGYFGYQGGVVTVSNQGTIAGSSYQGIHFGDGGTLTNSGTRALVTGAQIGVIGANQALGISNQGTIIGGSSDGIKLLAGGTVGNSGTGAVVSGGTYGVYASGSPVTVSNQGTIAGAAQAGIDLTAGGVVTNSGSGALISGGQEGIVASNVAAAIDNFGSIAGGAFVELELKAGGTLINESGAHISGGEAGIFAYGQPATVTNQGRIAGASVAGVDIVDGGSLTNANGGYIGGASYGARGLGGLAVTNLGTIVSTTGAGVYSLGGTVTNAGTIRGAIDAVTLVAGAANRLIVDPGAVFIGTVDGGNTAGATAVSTLELGTGATTGTLNGLGSEYIHFSQVTVDAKANWEIPGTIGSGTILTNGGTLLSPVTLGAGATLSNAATGQISFSSYGNPTAAVYGVAATPTVINAGVINNYNETYGVLLEKGGTVINRSGQIYGYLYGVFVKSGNGTVANTANISAYYGGSLAGGKHPTGVWLAGNGSVSNSTGGTIKAYRGIDIVGSSAANSIVNAGNIRGDGFGVVLHGSGSITNQAVGYILGGAIGIDLTDGGTAINAGTISGHSAAVQFGLHYSGRMIVDPGAAFIGTVDGRNPIGATARTTLELATAAASGTIGTLSGLGSQFINFANTTIDSGATWVVDGYVVSGATLTNSGSLAATLTLASGALLTNTPSGTIGGAGVTIGVTGAAAATVANYGSIGASQYGVALSGGLVINQATITGTNGAVSLTGNGTVTNAATALISGGNYGVLGTGVTIDNLGTIIGVSNSTTIADGGVGLSGGGAVTNAATALISGGLYGVVGTGGALTIANQGTIRGTGNAGVALFSANGSVTNLGTAALISGGISGMFATGASATVSNAGTIVSLGTPAPAFVGAVYLGVYLGAGGTVTNTGTSAMIGARDYGVWARSGAASVTNQGTIAASGATGIGVALDGGGTVTNAGTIAGAGDAVTFASGFANQVVVDPGAVFSGTVNGGNTIGSTVHSTLELAGSTFGYLPGVGSQFIDFANVTVDAGALWDLKGQVVGSGATFSNDGEVFAAQTLAAGALLTNQSNGIITSFAWPEDVLGVGGPSTVVNNGNLSALGPSGHYAVYLQSGGLVINQAQGTIASPTGVLVNGPGTVVNSGLIGYSGQSGVELKSGGTVVNLAGTITGDYALQFYGAGTVTNAATLAAYANIGTAVSFDNGFANRMIVDPGAVFIGTVTGGNAINAPTRSTLELAAGSYVGTLGGLGSQFIDFASVTIDSDAVWVVKGSVVSGATLFSAGTLDATITLAAGARLTNSGTAALISGLAAAVYAGAAATVTNQGTVFSSVGDGVDLKAGGVVTNSGTAALISGSSEGLYAGAAATVTNQGTVFSNSGDGLDLKGGGTVTNSGAAALISGSFAGIYAHASATVINQGSIVGATTAGVDLAAGGTVGNGGTIQGATDAVTLAAGFANRVIVDPGAAFIGTVDGGNTIGAAASSTLELASGAGIGTLSGLGAHYIDFAAITVDSSATWTIDGDVLPDTTLTNAGTLVSGVTLGNGALLINGSTGLISAGSGYAVQDYGGSNTITNAGGTITGPGGILLAGGGSITNQSGGVINGAKYGGIFLSGGASTVVNAGTVSGALDAILFLPGNVNRMVVDPGAVLVGKVDGGNTIGASAVSTLELATGAGVGTLSGLGSQFVNFAYSTIDSGADWVVNGSVVGGATLANAGTLVAPVTLAAGALLTNIAGGTIEANGSSAAVYGSVAGPATVVNAGSIIGNGVNSDYGVVLGGGGVIANQHGGLITGLRGAQIDDGGTLINAGSINGEFGAVYLYGGGSVTNQSAASIIGNFAVGVALNGAATLLNAGSIAGASSGVALASAGAVTNQNGGTITGKYEAVVLDAGGSVTNLAGGVVSGIDTGVSIAGAAGTVVNAGSIGGGTDAVLLGAGLANRVVVDPGAAFSGTVDGGNTIGATAVSTLELATGASAGTLSRLGSTYIHFSAVTIDAGADWAVGGSVTSGVTLANAGSIDATLTLASGGMLSNATTGVVAPGSVVAAVYGNGSGPATVVNAGSIGGFTLPNDYSRYGVGLHGGGTVINLQGGRIDAAYSAVNVSGGSATVSNAGSIYGQSGGVYLLAGGSVTNLANATITGQTGNGVLIQGAATLGNAGTIVGKDEGVWLVQGGTVTNAADGTIAGGNYAVFLPFGETSRVVFQPGAVFLGKVDGGNRSNSTAVSTLELGGSGSGTLSGFGSQFINFYQVVVDPGGIWNFNSTDALGFGVTLTDNGSVRVGGGIVDDAQYVTIAATAGGLADATVAGTGAVWSGLQALTVGAAGDGSMLVAQGGTVQSAGDAVVAAGTGSGGSSANVNGAGSDWQVGGSLVVGDAASGVLDISAGGSVSAVSLDAASQTGSDGVITVTDAQSRLTVTGSLVVGDAGAGELSVLNGASVAAGGDLNVGELAGGSGNVDIENATLSVAGNLNLGAGGGAAVVTVGTGATLHVAGGLIGGPESVLNEFGVVDPNFDDGVNTLVGVSGTQDFPAYIDGFASFTISAGVTLTLESPSIYNNVAFVLGGRRDTTGDELVLNAGSVSSDTTVSFNNAHGTLVLGTNALQTIDIQANDSAAATFVANPNLGIPTVEQFFATINTFKAGDQIIVDTTAAATFSLNGAIVSVIENTATIGTLTFDSAANAQTAFDTPNALQDQGVCFCKGTLIRTPDGEVAVEKLQPGDRVTTLKGEARRIIWIGTGRVMVTRGRRSAATPVTVRKGALADNVPHHDLHVTKGHSFFIDDVLVPVEFLVNHRTILWDDWAQEVTIYHVELETHDVLLANGAPAESYRDDGNRWLFQNENPGWHLPPQAPCAPVLTGGAIVDAIWLRLMERSGPRRHVPLTDDPDLHLMVDGKRVEPLERSAGRYVFRVKQRPRSVRIVSRSAVPQELGFARDARLLGVAVRQLVLAHGARQRTLDAEALSLVDGYHQFEAAGGIRWTDGDAAVPAVLFDGADRAAMLIVQLGGTTQYLDDGTAARAA